MKSVMHSIYIPHKAELAAPFLLFPQLAFSYHFSFTLKITKKILNFNLVAKIAYTAKP